MKQILLIPKIKVHNANALSSPYTIGFPAMTAWLGTVHALERKLKAIAYSQLKFKSMAVVCHSIDLQTHKGTGDYVYSIIGTGNPLDKNGKRPSFIEEARCHLNVSLVIEYEGLEMDDFDEFLDDLHSTLHSKIKIAAGDVISFGQASFDKIRNEKDLRKLTRQLMPGHCLIERRDLMISTMTKGQDAIDALLDHLQIFNKCEQDKVSSEITWTAQRKESGWIVPIATGFHGITELGQAKNQRDPITPHRFAESIITLGQFVMPYRINNLDNMLWKYHNDLDNNLYLCQQVTPTTKI